jgi:indolepyruvate ferredoxin oxidoreductase
MSQGPVVTGRENSRSKLISGQQALVELLLLQSRLDRSAGRNTAGFVSGYRGSPLGGLDLELWRAADALAEGHIRFEPGLNEELAATSIWGAQQANLFGDGLFDGVFSLWYGKGPGVDRSGDAFKHGNAAGTSPYGGVLVAAGDDHVCKSSTVAQQSEYAFMHAMLPVLNPASVAELIDMGVQGYALSRYSGCWVGFIVTQETADATQSVAIDAGAYEFAAPDFALPPDGLHIRWPDPPLAQEHRLHAYKLPAALAFARANPFDTIVWDSPRARVGLVSLGKSHGDLMQALANLGIDARRAAELGIRVYKVGMSWPLEPHGLRRFADGLEEIIVVEEKRGIVESQIKEQLFGLSAGARPVVVGKTDEAGAPFFPSAGELSAGGIARLLLKRLARIDRDGQLAQAAAALTDEPEAALSFSAGGGRMPHFCSGCPHNTSTRVPEGSRAAAGIGCHFMALWMDRSTATFTQMGGEGATWIGQAPFVRTSHMFQNLGDGTYTHSGHLAIRAAVAAGVNITFKILYNDAVAMTGGQPVEGAFSPSQIAAQLVAEGVSRVVIVSARPETYTGSAAAPPGVDVFGRDAFDAVQIELRNQKGVSALIYDQACAAETRRKRKRGLAVTPPRRVVINELVCEGCGDCSVQSNCLSVLPLETSLGRKRTIDQSACNRDYSCLQGLCPSFVTIEGARPRSRELEIPASLPEPTPAEITGAYNVVVAGIGGTGVVTLGKLLGAAAHIDGRAVVELAQTGLAQKFGAVLSHVRIGNSDDALLSGPHVGDGQADLLLASDLIVAAAQPSLTRLANSRSAVVANAHDSVPPAFIHDRDLEVPVESLLGALRIRSHDGRFVAIDATRLATVLLGDAMLANVVMLGIALQRGFLPVTAASLDRAFDQLGGRAKDNRLALALGRYAAEDPDAVAALCEDGAPAQTPPQTLDELVDHCRDFLTGYQSAAYAARYTALVERVRAREAEVVPDSTAFGEAVAREYFRLLAYKDEYEVARLYTETGFIDRLRKQFDGPLRVSLHFAPPLFARKDPVSGRPRKRAFGPWIMPVMRLLARLRVLRGGPLDPFRYTAERRLELRLLHEYEALIGRLVEELDAPRAAIAVELADLPREIRGFGVVKAQAAERVARRRAALLDRWRAAAAG